MGLKVLLADDSAAIKKVVQLCLQDFGVELKTIGTGKDVLALAKTFNPDIALIDVMLPHKPGFEVAAEMKKDPALQKIPIIMLWSSFMEFDEAKFKASGVEDKLEKPFEAGELRSIVQKYVSKAKSNPLGAHLSMPSVKKPVQEAPEHTISKTNISPDASSGVWNMSSFEDITSFSQKLSAEDKAPVLDPVVEPAGADSDWVRKDLGKFKVNIDAEGMEENTVSFQYDDSKIKDTSFIMKAEVGSGHGQESADKIEVKIPDIKIPEIKDEEVSFPAPKAPAKASPKTPPKPESPKPSVKPALQSPSVSGENVNIDTPEIRALIEKSISELLEKEAKSLIEKAIWKIVPDMATQMIKDEIQRLTSEK